MNGPQELAGEVPPSPSSVASPFAARSSSSDAAKQRSSSTASSDAAPVAPLVPSVCSASSSSSHAPHLTLEQLGAATTEPTKPPPQSAVYSTFSFEEVMSPRRQNGKRYLGGFLQLRGSLAGGFLKTWKRRYFRLRDHGVVCYKDAADALPLFEIAFTARSALQLPGKQSATSSDAKAGGGALLLVLQHVDVVGHQTPAHKVDVPLYLKAESLADFASWGESLRLKVDAHRRALTQSAVSDGQEDAEDATARPTGETARKASADDDDAALLPAPVDAPALSSTKPQVQQQQEEGKTPPPPPPQALDPPAFARFQDKYLVMREVGEGSFSVVHKAVNRVTGCLCAVKCCKASAALDEEVRIMRRLSHPNVVGVEAVYTQESMCFIVMDFMEDGDLCERLIERQRLAEREAQVIVSQVLQGLEYLHRHHVLHRDIKPENILLHGDAVKIADFGLAKQLPSAAAMLTRSCGTLEYAAPELLVGQPYGLKSDVFSLGVVLYVLLFGAFPFSIESAAALQRMERFPDGVDVRDMSCLDPANAQWRSVSRDAQDVLLRMLAPREEDRVSARELLVHPWFDPDRRTSLASSSLTSSVKRGVRRDSTTWQMHEANAAGQERVRLADCEVKGFRELLACGLELTKYSNKRSAAPHTSFLSIDFVRSELQWTARHGGTTDGKQKRGRVIPLRDIQEIRVGHATETFAQAAKGRHPPPPNACVSVVCAWRTLDLVVKAPQQREFLVKGLTRVVSAIGGGGGGLGEPHEKLGGLERFKV